MSKVFQVKPKRLKRSNGTVLTPDMVVTVENKQQTRRINEIMKEYRKEFYAEGQLFFFLKAHNYSTYYGCGLANMTSKEYQMPLPDNEKIFGNNSTTK